MQKRSKKAPTQKSSKKAAKRKAIQKAPAQKPSKKAPARKPSKKAPAQKPSKKAPTRKPSKKAPTQKPSKKAPAQKPSKKAPTQKPSKKAPTQKPSKKAPTQKPSKKAPTQKPSKKAPTQKPATKAPTQKPATKAPNPWQGKYLRIANKVSGFGLLAGSHGTNPDDRQMWQYPFSETGPNAKGFEWMLMPTFEGPYLIINRVSGFGLLAGSYGASGDRKVWQYPVTELGGNNPDGFRWGVEAHGDAFHIVNIASGFALLAGSYGAGGDRLVWQYPLSEVGSNEDAFLWALQETGERFNVPELRPGEADGAMPLDVPRLRSITDVPVSKSESWVMGEVLIPFMYVKDGAVSNQLRANPYYVLCRERYWSQIDLNEYDGRLQRKEKVTIKTGITETQSRSLENELGIKISADASFSYGGMASASLKTEIENRLKVTETSGVTKSREEETIVEITVPNETVRIVTWVMVERFTLKRGDESLVGQPSEVTLKSFVHDSYPHKEISHSVMAG